MGIAIGGLIISAETAAEVGASVGITGTAVQGAVGTAVLIGVTATAAGISAAFAPGLPKGQASQITQNKTIGARQAGYARFREAAVYQSR
jgi:hypothetical protein